MSEKIITLNSWQEVIIDFFEHKIAESKLYKARKYISEKETKINSLNSVSDNDEKERIKLLKAKEKKVNEQNKLRKESSSGEIRDWINKNANKSGSIIKSTHVLKFSHTSSEAACIRLEEKNNTTLLSTASFNKPLTYDLAHNNGALISVSRFLALNLLGIQIIDLILNNDFCFLEPFKKDREQLERWKKGFSNLVEEKETKTADKAKQIYFPLPFKNTNTKIEQDYHLLVPFFSSSFAEEIYSFVSDIKYGEEQNKIKKIKPSADNNKHSTYISAPSIDTPNLGNINFGGEYPRNVSMLNADRGGKCYLFSTQPPTWQSQLKPPINRKSCFDDFYNSSIKTELNYLRDFLLRFKNLDLSIKDPKRKQWVEKWVNNIIDELFFYAGSMQNLPSGWSKNEKIKLKPAHQYFLDPYREETEFQSTRQISDWQSVVCTDFSYWLNRQLMGQDKQFTPKKEHRRMWIKLLEKPLREFMEPIEQDIKQISKEEV